MYDRFEIGLYEQQVSVWVQRWFLKQRLNAGMLKGRWDNPCLDGKIAKTTDYWCNVGRSHVGSGQVGMIFGGTILIRVRISASVAGSKVDGDGAGLSVISGCGAPAEDVLIFCTLLLKKSAKSPVDSLDDVPCCGGWSRLSCRYTSRDPVDSCTY